MDKKQKLITLVAFLLSCIVLIIGSNPNTISAKILGFKTDDNSPKQLYRVYLAGNSIGVIKSKQELENYINEKQKEIKEKYQVHKIYIPNNLDIIKEITYDARINSVEEIYSEIEEIMGVSSFTIDGYKIEIEGVERTEEDGTIKTEDITLYVLDKNVFTNSVDKTVTAFVDPKTYQAYLENAQRQLAENEEGTILENLYIKNKITITKERIPAGGKIYTTEEELSKFLLFGTTDEQESYVVKAGDTIEKIATNNKLSTEEFLIANTNFKSAQDLLYPGQVVKLGLISPQFDLVEEQHIVSKEKIPMEIIYKDDNNKPAGTEEVEQDGQDGLALVTRKAVLLNGEIQDTVQVGNEIELIPAVNKIIVRGTKRYSSIYDPNYPVPVQIGSWVWPTNIPYIISSPFAWRGGKHHDGIDISGIGYGSTIKAANNGVVVISEYTDYNGNWMQIKHSNGLYTVYAHMASRTKQVGEVVYAGEKIGTAGDTGFATGVHLHFGVFKGYPFMGGVALNPLQFY